MLAVEGVHVVCPSTTSFPVPVSTSIAAMATTATAPTPTMVAAAAAAGVGLLPMVTVAAETDPRSLLVPVVPTLGGSNTSVGNIITSVPGGSVPTTSSAALNSNNNNNNTTASTATANPGSMEQAEDFVKPIVKDGEVLLEVECGQNKAAMYLSKLCQGSKGPCINFQGSWLTPNEFQFVSGRETAKDWKRSIRHHGKSLKLLLAKGILNVHPTMCDCDGCRIGAVLTRKGEKRRIPNGERKRKSTGNAPENPGNGAFRSVTNLAAIKNQDGPSEPKIMALEKSVEGNQSPLKESSLLNVPAEVKEVTSVRVVDSGVADSKVDTVRRLPAALPLMPLASPEQREYRDSSVFPVLTGSASVDSSSTGAVTPRQPVPGTVSVSAPVSPSSEVKALSSSVSAVGSVSALDKSLSRLALYHAASASIKGSRSVEAWLAESARSMALSASDRAASGLPVSANPEHDNSRDSAHSNKDNHGHAYSSAPSSSDEQSGDERSPSPEQEARAEFTSKDEVKTEKDVAAVSENGGTDCSKDQRAEDCGRTVVRSHSVESQAVKQCEPNNNNHSVSVSVGVSVPIAVSVPSAPVLTSPVIASAAPVAAPESMPPHTAETEPKNYKSRAAIYTEAATVSTSTLTSSAYTSTSLLSPHHSEKEGHITIRHPSPERQPQDLVSPMKHSPVKPHKDHSAEKHHHNKDHSAERHHHKDRKTELSSSSTSSEHRDRHSSKDSKDTSSSARHSHSHIHSHIQHSERDTDRHRRHEHERADRDRKAASSSGHSSRVDDAGSSHAGPESVAPGNGGAGRGGEGARPPSHPPTSAPMTVPSVQVPAAALADPAAFSEYMRMLAASQNGFAPPSMGCIPGMFPLRPPTDPTSMSSAAAMMHPMQAAACGMFSSPTALLSKDPAAMYSAGAMPPTSYGYGAHPGMAPLHLLPQQYSSPSSAASFLDYSRSFPYLQWAGGLPLMMPDAMMAAAAAGSSAKRSREEMEALEKQRLQFGMPPFAMGSITPMDYMAAYRGMGMPISCGLESSMYEKNAELLRKRMYPAEMGVAGVGAGAAPPSKSMVDSPYLASLPEYYRALYCCPCMDNQPGDIRTWPVEEVVKLVSSLDGCSVYSEIFREQRVNGKILVLLTTEHLMKSLGMKLGPAMTLTSRVAKLLLDATRTSGCNMCQRLASMAPAVQSAVSYS